MISLQFTKLQVKFGFKQALKTVLKFLLLTSSTNAVFHFRNNTTAKYSTLKHMSLNLHQTSRFKSESLVDFDPFNG